MNEEDIRKGIQDGLAKLSQRLCCHGDVSKQQFYKSKLFKKLFDSTRIAVHTDKANEQHYEVPVQFFKWVLDDRMKYSCALWDEDIPGNVDFAQEQMLELICKRADIQEGQKIMDLGCGWGSFGLYILEKYKKCYVTCFSNSNNQRLYIEGLAESNNVSDRLRVITADASVYNNPQHSGQFDRIISIEMLEHMRNYHSLFKRISSWLAPRGLFFTQILCHRSHPYLFSTERASDTEWMAQNFFTGGTMPSVDLFLYFQDDLKIRDVWVINGRHYTKTLDAWLESMNKNMLEVRQIFHEYYGKDEVDRRVFNWKMFFLMCSEVFGFNNGNDWVVAHHLFEKRDNVSNDNSTTRHNSNRIPVYGAPGKSQL